MGRRIRYILGSLVIIFTSGLLMTGCPQIDLKLFVEELVNSAQPDTTPPTVLSVTPVDGATGVDRTPSVTIEFSEAVDPATISGATLQVNSASTSVPGTITYDEASNAATFVPDNELTLLSTLTVTVTAAIADAAGNALSEDYSWSFKVRDGSWGTMTALETTTGGRWSPAVDIDPEGNAIAVWHGGRIESRRFVNDTTPGWTSLVNLDFNTPTGSGRNPDIAINSTVNAFAVWRHDGPTQDQFRANFYDASSGWQTTNTVVYDPGGNVAGDIFVDADASGNAFSAMNLDTSIQAKIDTGTSWDTAGNAQIDGSAFNNSNPAIAVSSNGSAVVVYQESNYIRANRYDGSSWNSPGPIDVVNNSGDGVNNDPDVAIFPNGNALIIWGESGAAVSSYLNTRTLDSGTLGPVETLATHLMIFYGFGQKVAAAPDGTGMAIYRFDNKIYAVRYDGTSWESTATELTTSGGTVENPHIRMDAMGNAVAVWTEEGSSIFAKRFRNDGSGWQETKIPLQSDTGTVSVLDIAVSDNGTAVVVWKQDFPDPNGDIFSNIFK
jgi:hypothetical protein